MAKVVATHPDDQGQVRSVTVLTSNGSKLNRPINKLVLLVEAYKRDRDSPTRSQRSQNFAKIRTLKMYSIRMEH